MDRETKESIKVLFELLVVMIGLGALVSCFTDDLWKMLVIPPAILVLRVWE